MAIVSQIYQMEFLVQDGKGKLSQIVLPIGVVGNILAVADLVDVAIALEILIDPLIRGKLARADCQIELYLNSITSATPDVSNEVGALFTIAIDDSTDRYLWRLPSFDENFIIEDDIIVDNDALPIAALYNFFATGMIIGGKQLLPCDESGNILEGVVSGVLDYQSITSYLTE